MNKKALLALLLAMCMLLSSCALVVKHADVDAATTIVTVNDKTFDKATVQAQVNSYLQYAASYYASNYGTSFDTTNASNISAAQDAVIDSLVEQEVKDQKMAEFGIDTLSEEDQATIDAEYQSWYDMVASIVGTQTDMTDEEYKNYIDNYVYYFTGSNYSSMVSSFKEAKLKAKAVEGVTVSDEEVQADYDAKVEAAKTSYETDVTAYGTAVNNGETVYYRPAGYRMVKNLLIKLSTNDSDVISDLQTKATAQATAMTTAQTAIEATEGADLAALTAQVTVTVAEVADTAEVAVAEAADTAEVKALTTKTYAATSTNSFEATEDEAVKALQQNVIAYAEAKALNDAYTAAKAEATETAYANIDAKTDAVLAQLAEDGSNWDEIMAQYTEDTGMQGDTATAKTGYAVCANFSTFDSAFVEAAMGIDAVGHHSNKTRGSYGYYIIQYASEVAEGPVALADVSESISSALLTTKQDEAYTAAVAQWVSEAKVIIDKKALND